MLGIDSIGEIISTIRRNKLRTLLTGFAVAWGIFLLMVLLSAGNGLRNGFMSNFGNMGQNVISLYPGTTSVPSRGLPVGRRVSFDSRDVEFLKSNVPELEYISAEIWRRSTFARGEESESWNMAGVYNDYDRIGNIKMRQGRFVNAIDMEQRRKVVVLHPEMQKILFGEGEDPIGSQIDIDNSIYTVVGVYEPSDNFNRVAYTPLPTAQTIYNRGWGVNNIQFTAKGINTLKESEAFEARLRGMLGALHGFDPGDRAALGMWSTFQQAKNINKAFGVINTFITLIGIASMMAGIVGVGNIMLITVKERTREIGIRKAIGATPWSVIRLIILEAIFITTCAGYVGILLGAGVTAIARHYLSLDVQNIQIFKDPSIELGTVIRATLFLIACGVVAGLIPALKATKVRPIEAMRAE